jgi:hypothetical protein
VQLIFDALGGPGNALSALNSTGVALAGAMQAGNASAAAAAILDAPANMANGFLNGQSLITLPSAEALGLQTTVSVPLGGILTPLSLPELDIEILGMQNLPPGTSLIGGLIPGLLSADSQLAQAITPTT